jgi:pectin methylesterase-like acyl-CoA thioesterase
MRKFLSTLLAFSTTCAALAVSIEASAAAQAPGTVYVSPHASPRAADSSCATAAFRRINAAIRTVQAGGTVIACRGTYREDVAVVKPLTLVGHHAVNSAEGGYGTGMTRIGVVVGWEVPPAGSMVSPT